MNTYSSAHIEDLVGGSGKIYPVDMFIRYPFKEPFTLKNCLVICFSIVMSKHKGLATYYIEYRETFTDKTYKGNLDFNGFNCNGVLIIHTSINEVELIKKDLENNSSQFYKYFSECN